MTNTDNAPDRLKRCRLYLLAVLPALFFIMLQTNAADPDLWGKMSIGALMDQNWPFFPYHDVFSFTAAGEPWVDHEWGSGVIFYWLLKLFGSGALLLFKALMLGLTLWAASQCYFEIVGFQGRSEESRITAYRIFPPILLLAAFIAYAGYMYTVRCQIFSFLFFTLFLLILHRWKTGGNSKWLVLPPLLSLLWVNLHGGVILGFFVWGLYLVDALVNRQWRPVRTLSMTGLLMGVATLINPYGLAYHEVILEAWRMPRPMVTEWASLLTQLNSPGYILFAGVIALYGLWAIYSLVQKRKGFDIPEAVILATGLEALLHLKMLPLFALAILSQTGGLYLPPLSAGFIPPRLHRFLSWNYTAIYPIVIILVSLVMTGLHLARTEKPLAVRVSSDSRGLLAYPIHLSDAIESASLTGNFCVPFNWAQFLFWRHYPNIRVSWDGRFEAVYPEAIMTDHLRFYSDQTDSGIPVTYGADYVVVPSEMNPTVREYFRKSGWRSIYQNSMAILYMTNPDHLSIDTQPFTSSPRYVDDYIGNLHRFRLTNAERSASE